MIRYFERFNDSDTPMVEISEEIAKAEGYYAIEVTGDGIQRHFIIVSDGVPTRVAYPDSSPSPELEALIRDRDLRVPSWVIPPVEHDGETTKYTVWSYDAAGQLEQRTEHIYDSRHAKSTWYFPDGALGGWIERDFAEDGSQIEAREFNAATGRTIVHD